MLNTVFCKLGVHPRFTEKSKRLFKLHWGLKFSQNLCIVLACICPAAMAIDSGKQLQVTTVWWRLGEAPGLTAPAKHSGNCSLTGCNGRALWEPLQAWLHGRGLQESLWGQLWWWRTLGAALPLSLQVGGEPGVTIGGVGERDGILSPLWQLQTCKYLSYTTSHISYTLSLI